MTQSYLPSVHGMSSVNPGDPHSSSGLKRPIGLVEERSLHHQVYPRQPQQNMNAITHSSSNDDDFGFEDDFGFDDIDEDALLREVELAEQVHCSQLKGPSVTRVVLNDAALSTQAHGQQNHVTAVAETRLPPTVTSSHTQNHAGYTDTMQSHGTGYVPGQHATRMSTSPLDINHSNTPTSGEQQDTNKQNTLEQQIGSLQSEVLKLRRDLSNAETQMQSLNSDLQMKSGEISLIRKNLSQKMTENNELREKLSSTIESNTRAKNVLHEMFKNEIEKLKTELTFKSQEIRLLQSQRKVPMHPTSSQSLNISASQKAKGTGIAFPTVNSFHSVSPVAPASPAADLRSIGINTEVPPEPQKSQTPKTKEDEVNTQATVRNFPVGEDISFVLRRSFCQGNVTISQCLAESGNTTDMASFYDAALEGAVEHRRLLCLELLTRILAQSTSLSCDFCRIFFDIFGKDSTSAGPISNLLDYVLASQDPSTDVKLELEKIGLQIFDSLITIILTLGPKSHQQIMNGLSRERCIALLENDRPHAINLRPRLIELVSFVYVDSGVFNSLFVINREFLLPWVRALFPNLSSRNQALEPVHLGFELLIEFCEAENTVTSHLSQPDAIGELISLLHKWIKYHKYYVHQHEKGPRETYIQIIQQQLRILSLVFASGSVSLRRGDILKMLIADLTEIAIYLTGNSDTPDIEILDTTRDLLSYFVEDPDSSLRELGVNLDT